MAPAGTAEGARALTTDRWRQIESLCHAALARPAAERAAFLAEACAGDDALRREVESLVARETSAASFLETPIAGAARAPLVGRQLGAYRIEEAIGAGGMGEVYRASDTRLARTVAVKILPRDLAADPDRRQRFQREARAVAALNHPNICTIHDVGHDEGIDYLVMELVEGETLAARLANGPLPLDQALARAMEIADALDRAHRQGIIHRDLKPGNVMLARAGSGTSLGRYVKLLDFGLARIVPRDADAAAPTDTTPMTEAGAVLGTLQYMAPEQIEGRPADARTDIFAFGALLYEMLTGRRAFTGDSTPRLMAAILRDDAPSLAPVRPPVPSALDWLVRTCLAKDPEDRFASIHDVLLELRRIAAAPSESGAPAASGRRRSIHLLWTGAALLAAVAGALAGARFLNPSRSTRVSRLSLTFDERLRLPPRDFGIALSPDGANVVFAGPSSDSGGLFIRSIDDRNVKFLSNTEGGIFPSFSPDGRWLGFFADGKLLKRSGVDGSIQTIAEIGDAGGVATWGVDGYILFGRHGEDTKDGVRRVSANGGPVEVLSRPDLASSEIVNSMPQRLPGSDIIIYTSVVIRFSGVTFNVMAMPAVGSPAKVLIPGASRAVALDDGRLFYQVGTSLLTATIDPGTLALGPRTTVAEGVFPNIFGGAWAVAGDLVVYRPDEGGVTTPVWVSRGGVREPVGAPVRSYSSLRLSPDGGRVAFRIDDKDSTVTSWVYNLKAGVLSKVTPNALSGTIWSDDGRWLTVEGGEGRAMDLYQISADGSGEPKAILRNGQPKYSASWTPDGRTLIYMQFADPTSGNDLWAIDPEGDRTPRPIVRTPASELGGRLSPDGRWLAYVSNQNDRTGPYQLYVTPFPGLGARWQLSTGGAREPVWSRDGRELFYRNESGNQLLAVAVRADTTFKWDPARVLFEGDFYSFGGPGNQSYDVSPDGTRFLMLEVVRPAPRLDVIQGWQRIVNSAGR